MLYLPRGMDAYQAVRIAESYALLTNKVITLTTWDYDRNTSYWSTRVVAYALGSSQRKIEHDFIGYLAASNS